MESAQERSKAVIPNRASEPVFVFLAYLFAQFVVLSAGEHFPGDNPLLVAAIFSTFSAALGAVAAGLWIDRANGHQFVGRINPRIDQLMACVGAGFAAGLVVYFLTSVFPNAGSADPMLAKAFLDKGPAILLGWMVTILVVAPIGEEMVFRGAIQGHLARRVGSSASVVVSALLFLLIHMPQLGGYWPAMLAIFGLGVTAGIARVKTRSLLGAIVTHVSYNSVMMIFVITGNF